MYRYAFYDFLNAMKYNRHCRYKNVAKKFTRLTVFNDG